MNVLKQLQNSLKGHHVLLLLALIVAGAAVYQYSSRKGSSKSGFNNSTSLELSNKASIPEKEAQSIQNAQFAVQKPEAANPAGTNEVYSAVEGVASSSSGLPAGCQKQDTPNPSDLLPKDSNNQFAALNPQGSGDLQAVNLLKAGHHIGINTVGSSLRNANLQVRSEPANPQLAVSPWMNSTISPDYMRAPFEIGCGQA